MPVKEIGSSIINNLTSGFGSARGPTADLFNNKHGYESFSFPSDIEGIGQRHFLRFNVITKDGAYFETAGGGRDSEQAQESTTGEFLGGLVSGLVGDAIGGSVGGFGGGLAGSLATNVLDQTGIGAALDTGISAATGAAADLLGAGLGAAADLAGGAADLFAGAIGGILPDTVETTFGKLNLSAEAFRNAIAETVPISQDALSGIGDFPGSIGGVPAEFSTPSGGTKKSEADIVLYVPFALNETYQANWTGGDMGLIGMALATAGGGLDAAIAQATNMSNLKGAAAEVGGKIAGQVLGNPNIEKKALKMQGKSINPYFELFFESVAPRTFSFDFKMSPRNAQESEAIQNIVRAFKTFAAPPGGHGESLRYWGYPSMFEIEYWNVDKIHKLKPCALQNITINYAGAGTNHTFYDGTPIQTDMTLTFMESELLTRGAMKDGY